MAVTLPVFQACPEGGAWRPARPGRTCRGGAGPGRPACGHPATVETHRPRRSDEWWPFCLAHSHGRWVDRGRVVTWRRAA